MISKHYFVAVDKTSGVNVSVMIVDANFWKKNRCMDSSSSLEVTNYMEQNNMYELLENIYESGDEFDTVKSVKEKMKLMGFEENKEFENYIRTLNEDEE